MLDALDRSEVFPTRRNLLALLFLCNDILIIPHSGRNAPCRTAELRFCQYRSGGRNPGPNTTHTTKTAA